MPSVIRTRINKPKTKTTFLPQTFSLPVLFKKRAMNSRTQAIKSDLAARTLYVMDGDDIVITSLDRKPFCCQEELSCMRRSELCRVARELNRKLPRALVIEPLAYMSEDAIRHKIEEMMGFRHLRRSPSSCRYQTSTQNLSSVTLVDLDFLLSKRPYRSTRSPTSSLSSRSSKTSTPCGLDVVAESDEEGGLYLSKRVHLSKRSTVYEAP
ncbi:hypothetical protein Clacol_000001 [Clathrus columnatus]|uniref:Uncharacterized protein n=1 Tax=Clathrus columnatus TaxID=1419009 RepID=A0AAV4ZZK5_9AGAM|nr:hypothetical protein Clacol_000001 [Clathrus columnatus]